MYLVFSKKSCPYCDKAVKALEQVGDEYKKLDIEEDQKARAVFDSYGFKTVPQVFLGDHHIGGYMELSDYLLDNM